MPERCLSDVAIIHFTWQIMFKVFVKLILKSSGMDYPREISTCLAARRKLDTFGQLLIRLFLKDKKKSVNHLERVRGTF